MRNLELGIHFLKKITVNLNEIQYAVITCWLVEAHAKFILYKS